MWYTIDVGYVSYVGTPMIFLVFFQIELQMDWETDKREKSLVSPTLEEEMALQECLTTGLDPREQPCRCRQFSDANGMPSRTAGLPWLRFTLQEFSLPILPLPASHKGDIFKSGRELIGTRGNVSLCGLAVVGDHSWGMLGSANRNLPVVKFTCVGGGVGGVFHMMWGGVKLGGEILSPYSSSAPPRCRAFCRCWTPAIQRSKRRRSRCSHAS